MVSRQQQATTKQQEQEEQEQTKTTTTTTHTTTHTTTTNSTISTEGITLKIFIKSTIPFFSFVRIKSDCVASPQKIIFEFSPIRVIIESNS